MNLKRLVSAGVMAVLAAGAVATAAVSLPATADLAEPYAGGCVLDVVEVRSLDLQEPPQDEIYLQIGDGFTRTRTFVEFQARRGSDFGDVSAFIPENGSTQIRVWEADFPSSDDPIGGAIVVTCNGGTFSEDRTGSLGTYRVTYAVTEL